MNRRIKISQWPLTLRCGVWLICALPLLVAGQPRPSTLPSAAFAPGQQGLAPDHAGDAKRLRAFGMPPGAKAQAREEEWKVAEQFFKDYAPHYLAKVEKLTLPEARLRQLHTAIVARYETLQRLHEHFPELFDVRIQQLKLFDSLVATHEQFEAAGSPEKDRLRAQMKQELTELFSNSLKDRQTRINRLQEMLGKLQGSVEQDTHRQQELVDAHFQKVLDKGVDPGLLDGLVKDDSETAPLERPVRRLRPTTAP